ncbi:MAG: hypothetical protein V4543_18425 [Bacteroidota bacterium]
MRYEILNFYTFCLALLICQGCRVCISSYELHDRNNAVKYSYLHNGLGLSGSLTISDHKEFHISLYIGDKTKKEKINSILVKVQTDNGQELTESEVKMVPYDFMNYKQSDSKYRVKNFSELLENELYTKLGNDLVSYYFYYTSDEDIIANSIVITVVAELDNRTIYYSDVFYLNKHCFYTVH